MEKVIDNIFNSWTNVTSDFRNELVFEERNKEYGAYLLRKKYNKSYSLALLITIAAFVIGFSIPKILTVFKAKTEVIENVDTQVDLEPPPVDKNEPEPPPPPPPPPPPAQEMVKFTPPVVVDEPVVEEVVTQEKLVETQAGEKTQEGTGDDNIIIPDEVGDGDQVIEQPKEVEPFVSVEQMPEFPGGEGSMMKFIAENLEYPQQAKDANIEGRVHLKFTVTADGHIKDIVILNKEKLGYGCEEAAIAVIKKMPKWKPGRQNGQPVPVYFNIPIRFRLF